MFGAGATIASATVSPVRPRNAISAGCSPAGRRRRDPDRSVGFRRLGSTRVSSARPWSRRRQLGRVCRVIVLFDDDPAPGDIREIDFCRAARDLYPGKLVEMIGETGENRLWGRAQDRAATAQDQLDDDRRDQDDAGGRRK